MIDFWTTDVGIGPAVKIMRDKGKRLLFLCPFIVHNNSCLKLNGSCELLL